MSESTEKNLALAFAAESKASVRNATFAKKAEMEGYSQIARLFRAVAERETDYYVCQVCGYVSEDQAPDKCPVCGAIKEKFQPVPRLEAILKMSFEPKSYF